MIMHCIFFWIASIFARWAERNCSSNHTCAQKANFRLLFTLYLNLQHPFIVWGFSKYHFHIPFNILLIAANKMSNHILYFYKIVRPGTFYNTKLNWVHITNYEWMILGFQESPLVRQSQTTLFIFNSGGLAVTFVYRTLSNANTLRLPLLMTMALGIILVGVIRDYMKKYVDTSKI